MNTVLRKLSYGAICAGLLAGCKGYNDMNPKNPGAGDQEVITRITLHMTNASDTTDHILSAFSDPEGEGVGAGPTIDSLLLKKGITYYSYLEILDETKNPVVNTSNEIAEEANYHRFYYTFIATSSMSGVNIGVTITDADTRTPPMPLGLVSTMQVGTATGTGIYNINLRHFSEGEAKTNNPADGETDIYIDFPVRIY